MAEKVKAVALTTIDNPWSYFDNFEDWLAFDLANNYDCCGITARIANVTDDMSSVEARGETERAIKEFVAADPIALYSIEEKYIDYEPILSE